MRIRKPSPLHGLILPVYAPSLIWSTGSGALAPVMVLAALSLGFSSSGASAIAGISGLVGVLTGPWVGRRITTWGDRAAFLVGTGLAVVSLVVTLIALAHPGALQGQIGYVLGIVALAVSANIWSLARQTYVAESVPAGWRARAMSNLGGMLRLGQLIGPALGSLAIAWWGLPGSFWLQIVTTLIALAFVLGFVLPDPTSASSAPSFSVPADQAEALTEVNPLRPTVREHADRRATALLSIGITILGLVRANRAVVIPLMGDAQGISAHMISATFGASAILDTAMFIPAGHISDRFGRLADLLPTMVIMGFGFILMVVWTSPIGFVVSACLIGFGNGFGSGIVMTMGADLSPDVNRSGFLGLWQSISLIGQTVGPFAVSALVAIFGVGSSAWMTGVLSLVGGVWFLLSVPRAYARLGVDDRGRPLGKAA